MSEKRYQKNCRWCNKTFTSQRSDAKFCSGKCRAKFSRDEKDKLMKSQAKQIALWKSKYIEQSIYDVDKIRMETVRNMLIGETPDEVRTENYLLKRVDDGNYSVEKLK